MKLIYHIVFCMFCKPIVVQNKARDYIEGGKTLIELISVFLKKPASANSFSNNTIEKDSCAIKQQSVFALKIRLQKTS